MIRANIHKDGINKILKKAVSKSPDGLTGKTKQYEKELYVLFGKKENTNEIHVMKLYNMKRYLVTCILLILIIAVSVLVRISSDESPFDIDSKGQAYIPRPELTDGIVRLDLVMSGSIKGESIRNPVVLNIKPEGINATEKKAKKEVINPKEIALKNLSSVVYSINKNDTGEKVYLPDKITGIQNVTWKAKKDSQELLILLAGVTTLLGIYFARYDRLKRLKRACNESIVDDLPEFINKMVLLMNAGLVLTAAFEKVISDYESCKYKKKSYFYDQLTDINIKITETHASMTDELKRFSERSGNREFMRITNVISDNIHKGTELVDVLQSESSFLWFQRKKRAEEKGRMAETKLTIPLALQLLVLIMITLAPAMIDM